MFFFFQISKSIHIRGAIHVIPTTSARFWCAWKQFLLSGGLVNAHLTVYYVLGRYLIQQAYQRTIFEKVCLELCRLWIGVCQWRWKYTPENYWLEPKRWWFLEGVSCFQGGPFFRSQPSLSEGSSSSFVPLFSSHMLKGPYKYRHAYIHSYIHSCINTYMPTCPFLACFQ